jgi:hypothetical protein
MGLLDDAIREHLELKRRHGADAEEVSRQEEEALGAAQRAEFAPTPDENEEPPGQEPEVEAAAEPDEEPPTAAATGEPFDIEADEAEAPPPGYEEDPWLEEEPDEVPAEESLERPQDAAEKSEDVLEETPEFLQETPEHDRLWFEQKPPRDFDWDK